MKEEREDRFTFAGALLTDKACIQFEDRGVKRELYAN